MKYKKELKHIEDNSPKNKKLMSSISGSESGSK